MASACRNFCFETTSSGWQHLRRSPALSSPMIFRCNRVLNSGSLLKAAEAAGSARSRQEFKSKNEEREATGGFYSVYSVQRLFEALVVFSAFSVVRMHRNGRVSSLFSTELRFPKLDTGVRLPSPAPTISIAWQHFAL